MKKIIVLLFLSFIFASCEKKTDFYKVEVQVVSESGLPIQNATVKLTVPIDDETLQDYSYTTGVDGKAFFELKNEAYYNIQSWKWYYRGCNYVELKKNETVKRTVVLRGWDDPYNGCLD